jgi:CheY-like chemotaxis protein
VLVASSGEDGLLLAAKFFPKAIILDLDLPGMDGRSVLSELKADPALRHIPVHIISAMDRSLDPIKAGAVEYLMKPIDKDQLEEAFLRIENFINRKMKNLLIIEDDQNSRKSIKVLVGNGDVKCLEAGSGKEALEILEKNDIDCIVLDLGLPDISGFDLIKKIQDQKDKQVPPIIIYTGKELSKEENEMLQSLAESIIIKGVKSEERLLDETALFLHRTVNNLPDNKKDMIKELYNREAIFHNKKILIVDDDMRNTFALSKVLKEQGMEIVKAENGLKALEAIEAHPNISLVLMDVMMPEMDGLEAIRRIRTIEKFKDLPIISLTAKAMKEDRKKCIDAGANDYISKPIELERLLSLMKIWIKK